MCSFKTFSKLLEALQYVRNSIKLDMWHISHILYICNAAEEDMNISKLPKIMLKGARSPA